jgi:adenine-specific DNA-methyltransferase
MEEAALDKLNMETKDMTQENIEKVGALFPNVITEIKDEGGKIKKGINFERLKQELSKDVVDGEECYDFTWVGKKAAIIESNTPIRKALRPCIEESKDWENTENLYIEGDNLDVLKLLQESYLNSIKMIYIDPPYNTGNDFIYKDNFNIIKDEYEEQIGLYDEDENRMFKNTDTNGRFHSDWCSMIYPRLKLAYNLLSEDGVIFISIDDNEVENLKKICNEIFGESNFICRFIWKSKLGKVGTTSTISTNHEYILCFAKYINEVNFNMIKKENDGRKENLRQWGQADRREDRPSMFYPIIIDGIEVYPIKEDGTEGRWRVGKEKAEELIEQGMLELFKKENRYEIYRHFESGFTIIPYDTLLLDDIGTTAKGSLLLKSLEMNKIFDYSKPVDLIGFFVYLCTDNNDIILDFFSGSSTTAHAVMQQNFINNGKRKFIMVQLPEQTNENSEAYKSGYKDICDIGKERIRRAGEKIKAEIEENNKQLKLGEEPKKALDIGFRGLRVDSTNMKDVYYSANKYTQSMISDLESNIKEDRTDLDLLYGVMLDWGLKLSLSHKMEEIEGIKVHIVDEGSLVACFENKVSENVIREIAKRQPLRVVFRDSSFENSPDKINVAEIFKLLAPNTTVKVI